MTTPTRAVALLLRRLALAILLLPALAFAQDVARMDALVSARVADKSFMGAVLVARGDQVVLSKGYGFANLEWNVPNTSTNQLDFG